MIGAEEKRHYPLTDQQRFDWLRLIRSENVGPRTFRDLINRVGGARAALEALPDLARRGGAAKALRIASEKEIEGELRMMARLGARFIGMGEPDYPAALRVIDSGPPLIAVRGDAAILARPMVAIVGARNASALGLRFAATLARDLGEAGLVVASGLARGIDGAAHAASLASGTLGVLAGGLARIYPAEHEDLAARMLGKGAILSEMPIEWTATARDFPRRNRIISGLSYGVVIVEAALRSGSLITARFANEQGREVFAVPGSPLDPRSEGANRLIRQGATLTTSAQDILEVLAPLIATGEPPLPPLREDYGEMDFDSWGADHEPDNGGFIAGNDGDRLMALIGPAPVSVDELLRVSGLAARTVQMGLLELELAGRIERHGDNRVSMT